MMSVAEARKLIRFVNLRHGTTFRVLGRFRRGEQGAFELIDATGAHFVLKWQLETADLGRRLEVQALVRRLRDAGYPAPREVAVGQHPLGSYVVQEALPGAPAERIDASLVPQVFALNALQDGRAGRADDSWPGRVINAVRFGGPGYCLLDSMRRFGPSTACLLSALQAHVTTYANVPACTHDVVHFDFNPSNILVADGRITGVVDWDGACAGDRAFDLATLLFYSYEDAPVRDALWTQLTTLADPLLVSVYLAHLIHRQVDWSIRHHLPTVVESWLGVAESILRDFPVRRGCVLPR